MARAKKEATNLVIVNSTAKMLVGPMIDGVNHRFLPGQNNCPEPYWKAATKNKTVKQWLALGELASNGAGVAKKLDEGLDSLSDAEAAQRITKCADVKLLRDWLSKATNMEVKQMCEARIHQVIAEQGGDTAAGEGADIGVGGAA